MKKTKLFLFIRTALIIIIIFIINLFHVGKMVRNHSLQIETNKNQRTIKMDENEKKINNGKIKIKFLNNKIYR